MASSEARISYALNELDKKYTEYGPLISKVSLVKDNREKTTMWVNPHCEMGFNDAFIKTLKADQLLDVVHHELLHVINGHFIRETNITKVLGKVHHAIHNIAMDLEINSKLSNIPDFACFPKNYKYEDNLTYEVYLQKLLKDDKIKIIKIGPDGKMPDGSSVPNDADIDYINECPGVRNKSSSNGNLSHEDQSFLEDLTVEIEEASKTRGDQSGGFKSKISLKMNKPLDILQHIRILCSNIRQNRTFGYDNVNYNSLKSGTIPDIVNFNTYSEPTIVTLAFIIDVSGSRTDNQINSSISRIWSTLQNADDIEFIMDLYFTDAAVTQVNRVRTPSDIPKTYKGRGGTVLSSAYEKFKEKYDLVLILTDGYIDWPELDQISKEWRKKTVLGIDRESYMDTHKHSKFPTFVL